MAVSSRRYNAQKPLKSNAEATEDPDYQCRPDRSYNDDVPTGWEANKTAMCGVSWPSETPFTQIYECCSGPVEAYNACFQYCATDLTNTLFSYCAKKQMNIKQLGVRCNGAIASGYGQTTFGPAWMAGLLTLMNGYAAFLIGATFGVFLACLVAQCVSTSATIPKRLWSCFGMFFGVSVFVVLCETQTSEFVRS